MSEMRFSASRNSASGRDGEAVAAFDGAGSISPLLRVRITWAHGAFDVIGIRQRINYLIGKETDEEFVTIHSILCSPQLTQARRYFCWPNEHGRLWT